MLFQADCRILDLKKHKDVAVNGKVKINPSRNISSNQHLVNSTDSKYQENNCVLQINQIGMNIQTAFRLNNRYSEQQVTSADSSTESNFLSHPQNQTNVHTSFKGLYNLQEHFENKEDISGTSFKFTT